MKKFLLKTILFVGLLFLVVEVVFRVSLPAADMPYGVQIEDYGILALDRDRETSGEHTIGRYCSPSYHWNINNAGFNSAIDYTPASARVLPCAVLIGNSYSLGLYSDVDEHLAGQLHKGLSGKMEVYNLGVSGMPISQAPLVARFAEEKYEPELIIIQTSARSVSSSLRSNGRIPYCQQYSVQDGKVVTHPPSRFTPNKYKHLVRKSALVRYLYYNANYNLGGKGLAQDAIQAPGEKASGVTSGSPDGPITMALDEAMQAISAAAPEAEVLVIHDADRAAMYNTGEKPARLMNSEALEDACSKYGFGFLDLTDSFWSEYQQDKKRFNFKENYHWNPYGVSVVAKAVLAKLETLGIATDRSAELAY